MEFALNTNDKLNSGHNFEVHRPGCRFYPKRSNRVYLGNYEDARQVVVIAAFFYPEANGCKICCPEAYHK